MLHAFENNLNSNVGDKNPRAKIAREDAREIRRLYNLHRNKKALAKKYNLSIGGIENIIYNRTWKEGVNIS